MRKTSVQYPITAILTLLLVGNPCPVYVLAQDTPSPDASISDLKKTAAELGEELGALKMEKALLEQKLVRIQHERDTYEKEVFEILSGDFRAESEESVRRIVEMKEAEHRQELLRLRESDASWKKVYDESLQKISQLENSLSEYRTKLSRMEEAQQQLQGQWQSAQQLLAEHKNNLPQLLAEERAPLQTKVQELESQKKTTTDELVVLKSRLSSTEKKLADEEALRGRLSKELDALRQAKASVEKDLTARLENVQADLGGKNRQMQDQLAEKESQIKESAVRFETLSRGHEKVSQLLQSKEKENAALQQSAADARKDLQSRIELLTQQLAEKDKSIQDLSKDVKALQAQRDSQEEAAARTAQELKMLQAKLDEQQQSFDARLTNSLAQEKKLTADAQKQWQSARSVLEVREVELKELRRHADALDAALVARNQEFARLEKQFQESAHRLTEATSAFRNEKMRLQSDIQRLSGDVQEKDNLLSQRMEESKRLSSDLENQARELTTVRQTLEAEKEKARLRYDADTQELQQKVAALEQDIRDHVEAINGKDKMAAEQSAHIKAFEAQVVSLEKAYQEAVHNHSQAMSRVQDLTQQVKAIEDAVPVRIEEASLPFKKTIQELEARVTTLKEDNDGKLKAINALKEKRDVLSQEIQSRDARLEELAESNRRLQDDIASLTKSIPEQMAQTRLPLQKAIEDLMQKNAVLSGEIRMKEQDLEQGNQALANLQKNLSAVEGEANGLVEKNTALLKELDQVKASIPAQITEAREPVEKELQETVARVRTWEEKFAAQSKAYADLQKEHAYLGGEFAHNQQKLQQLTDRVGTLSTELESARKDLPVQIAKTEKPLLEKMAKLETQSSEKDKALSTKEAAIKESEARIQQLQKKIQQHQADHVQLTQAYDKITQEYTRLEASIPEKMAQAKIPLEKSLTQAQADIQAMTKTLDGKEKILSGNVKQIQTLENQVRELSSALTQSREQTAGIQSQWDDLKNRYGALEASVPEQVQAAKRPLEQNMAALETALDEQRTLLKQVQSHLAQKTQDVERLEGSVKQLEGVKEKLAAEKNTLTLRIQDMEKQWPDQLAKARQPLEQTIAELNKRIEAEKATIEQERASAKRLQQELSVKNNDIRQLQDHLKVSKNETETLSRQLTDEKDAVPLKVAKATEPLQANIQRLSAELKDLQQQLEAHKTNILAYQDKERAWTESSEALEEETGRLEKSLQIREAELQSARASIEKAAVDYKALQRQIPDQIQAAAAPLEQTIADLKALIPVKMEEARAPLLQEIAAYKEKVSHSEESYIALKNEHARLQSAGAALQKTIQALTSERDALQTRLEEAQKMAQADKETLQLRVKELTADKQRLTDSAQAAQANSKASLSEAQEQLQLMTTANQRSEEAITSLKSDLDKSRIAFNRLQQDKKSVDGQLAQSQSMITEHTEKLSSMQRQITAYEATVRKHLEDKNTLEAALARQSDELKNLRASIPEQVASVREPLTQELTQHKAMVTARDKDIEAKGKLIASLQKERETLSAQLQETESLRKQALNRIDILQRQWRDGQQVSRKAAQDLTTAEKQITDLDATIKQLQDKGAGYENELRNLQAEMASLKKSIPDTVAQAEAPLTQRIEEMQQDLAAQKAALSLARDKQSRIEGERDALSKDLKASVAEQARLQKAIADIESAVPEKIQAARQPLENELSAAQQTVARLEKLLTDKENALRISQEVIAGLEAAVKQRDADLAAQKSELQKLASKSQDDIRRHQDERDRLSSEKENALKQLAESQSLIKEKTKAVSGLEQQLKDREKALFAADVERVRLEKEWQDTAQSLKALEDRVPQTVAAAREPLLKEVDAWKAKLAGRDQELADKNKNMAALSEQQNSLKDKVQELEGARDELTRQVAALKTDIQSRDAQIQSKAQDLARASTEMQALQKLIQKLEEQNSGYEKEISMLQEAARNVQAGLPDVIAKAEEPLRQRIVQLETDARRKDEALPERLTEARQPLLNQIDQLRDELEARREEIAHLNAQRKSLEEYRKVYAGQLNASQDEVARLKQALDEYREALAAIEKSVPEQLAAAKAPLQESIEKLTQQLTSRTQDNARQASELEALDGQLKEKLQLLAASAEDIRQLKVVLDEKTSAIQNLEARIPQEIAKAQLPLNQRIVSLEQDIQKRDDALPGLLAEAKRPLLKRAEELQADIAAREKELSLREKTIAQLTSQYENAAHERDGYAARLTASEKEMAQLKQALDANAIALKALEESMPEQLASAKAPLETTVKELRRDIASRNQELAARKKEISTLQSQYDNAVKEREAYATRLADSEKQTVRLSQELDKSRASFTALEKSMPEQLASAKAPLEASVKELRANMANRESELARQQQEFAALQAQYDSTVKDREAYAAELSASKQGIARLTEELDKTRAALAALEKAVPEQLASAKAPLETSIRDLRASVFNREKEYAQLQSQYEAMSQEREAYAAKLGASEKEVAGLKQDLEKTRAAFAALETSLPEQLASAKAPLEESVDDLNRKLKNAVDTKQTLASQMTQLKSEMEAKDGLIKISDKRAADLNTALKEKLAVMAGLNEELRQLADENKRQADALARLEKESNEKSERILAADENAAVLKQEYAAVREQLSALQSEHQDLQTHATVLREDLAQERSMLSDKGKELEQALQNIASLNDSIMSLKETNGKYAAELNDLKKAMTDLEAVVPSQIEEARAPLVQQVQDLKVKLASVQETSEQQANAIQDSQRENSALKELRDTLHKEKATLESALAANQEQLIRVLDEKVILEQTVAEHAAQISQQETALAESRQTVAARVTDIEAYEQKLAAKAQEMTDLASQKSALATELEASRRTREGLAEEVAMLKRNIAGAQKTIQNQAELLKVASAKAAKYDALVSDLRTQEENYETQLASFRREIEALKEGLPGQLAEARAPLVQEVERLKEEARQQAETHTLEFTREKQARQDAVAAWQARYDAKVEEANRLSADTDALRQQLAKMGSDLEHVGADAGQLRAHQSKLESALQEKIALLNESANAMAALKVEADKRQAEMNAVQQKKLELEQVLTQREEELASLKRDMPNQLASATAPLESQISALTATMDQAAVRARETQKELESSRQEYARLANDQSELEKRYTEAQTAFEALRNQSDRLEKDYQKKLATERQEADAVQGMYEQLKKEHASLREIFAVEQKTRNQFASEVETLKAAGANLREQHQQELAAQVAPLQERVTALDTALNTLREQLHSKEAALKTEADTNALLVGQIRELRGELAREKAAWEEQLSERVQSQEALQQTLADLQLRNQQLGEAKAIIEKQKMDLEQTLASLEEDMKGLRGEVPARIEAAKAPLEDIIAQLKDQLVRVEEEGRQESAEAARIQKHAELVEQDLEKLKKDKALFEKTVATLNDQVQLTGQALNQQMEFLKSQNQSLTQKVADYERQLTDAKKDLKAAQGQSEQDEMQTLIRQLQEEITSARELIPSR